MPMEDTAVTAVRLAGDQGGVGLWALIAQADAVVKLVILVLVVASLWCWAVIFDKLFQLWRLRAKTRSFERSFWSGGTLDELYRRQGRTADHPMAAMFASAMEVWWDARGSDDPAARDGVLERIDRVMALTRDRELDHLERHLGWLATIGSTAPFVGLFGTVWGIMNSFQSIAVTKNTTLAVVAPGIAEALLATALGLVAAIPAVIAYNKLSGDVDRYANRLSTFIDEFNVVLSRQLERRSTRGEAGGSRAA
jgi:biopolymer transport protein TolQ